MAKDEFLLIAPDGKVFFVKNKKEYHTHLGKINLKNIKNNKVKTNTGTEFIVTKPTFIDRLLRAKRGPAVILPKDLGQIIVYAGIKPNMKILDIGTGSGWLAAYLAYVVGPKGKVITYEKNPVFANLAKKNFSFLGLKNIQIKIKDVYEGFSEKNVDVLTIDLPDPERILPCAYKALKTNGMLVAYLPQITQVLKLINCLEKENFLLYKILESFEREWLIKDKMARPQHNALTHTAFLLFAKKA